ncbi:3',5'-cyclic-nucleotide phosphodiesterase, variant 2 [Orbilia oligospora]|uniref:Phosphodiesterase n=1 Tax=Orbilia oligospora TaxID=2813651 RepID=A0A6G1M7W4_ORBOL|nr:3',5'-cyclic-nucleotide phosphodiesterase [Orbilia oligospora]KAF3247892.1 3',5'-cyclic-nucleotide phosphodiesterase, variant 2 [Orbilia oligospora]
MFKEISKCNVVYVDRRAKLERSISRMALPLATDESMEPENEEVLRNINSLLSVFSNVSVHSSASSCLATLGEISNYDPTPTVLLLDVPARHLEEDDPQEADRHDSGIASSVGDDPLYGKALLRHIREEMEIETYSQNILAVALISELDPANKTISGGLWTESDNEEAILASKLLDTGAAEAYPSPLTKENTKALSMHCYRLARKAQKRRTERKRSWVGVDTDLEAEERERKNNVRVAEGYAYLREKMVSELMSDIFKPNGPAHTQSESKIRVSPHRHELVRQSVCRWDFSAHEFTDDELLLCAFEMFNHAFTMPEVEEWRISPGQLTDFLFACRRAYNEQVPYHNFRHVVDVLQGVFYFCLALGVLPHFDGKAAPRPKTGSTTSLSKILRPFDALTLLIVAIGHDVGHPGVNNAFLVTLKAPLAQMYNDKSVLESFHCAAFSQVLRKHWPITQTVPNMRRLMIESILATDMGLHFDYMSQLEKLKQKIKQDKGMKNWDDKTISANRSLLCTLLIKCADISNVARRYDIAAQWTVILTDEFARQASLETDLKIPTSLAVPPVQGSSIALGKSQVGFMKLFAAPLFQSIADVMPEMNFGIAEVNANMAIWANLITECTEKGDRPFFLEKVRNSLYYQPSSNGAGSSLGASESRLYDFNDKQRTNGGVGVLHAPISNGGDYSGDSRIRKASQAYQEQGAPDLLGLGHHGADGKSSGSTTPPPSPGEQQTSKTGAIRPTRSRFNLNKIFRWKKTDTIPNANTSPKLPTNADDAQ